MLRLRIIPIQEWQKKMARHWGVENPEHISNFNNPFGMIRYFGKEIFSQIIFFPVCLEFKGTPVAYSSIYNISSTHLRIRGIYVEPAFRGKGFGHIIISKMLELWPPPWHTVIGYFRPETWPTFEKHSQLQACPLINSRVSTFSQKPLILAMRRFSAHQTEPTGNNFIKTKIDVYGLLGSNNKLNMNLPSTETSDSRNWGYDNTCCPNINRQNGRNIFFVDFDKFLSSPTKHEYSTPLRLKNLSYDFFQKKVIGTADWAIEFQEPLLINQDVSWSGDFLKTLDSIQKHIHQFEDTFTIDKAGQVCAAAETPLTISLSANYKHYVPLSRFEPYSNTPITQVYGTVDTPQ